MKAERKNILYKIYYAKEGGGDVLVYLGRTHQPLNNRLRGHFMKAPMMRELDPRQVSKIEYAEFKTEADMFLYEIYFINKLKPPLNKDDKSKEKLTVDLPPVPFQNYDCSLLAKWCGAVEEKDAEHEQRRKGKLELIELRSQVRKQLHEDKSLSPEEKSERWSKWLEDVFEPRMNELTGKEKQQ